MTRRIWWGDFSTTEFDGLDPDAVIAVLPLAAIEQHGPHLPVSTDFAIMTGMLETAIARMPDDMDVRILPVQAVGKSNEHLAFPGTLTVPATVLVEHWCELGASVARAGIRKLVLVNSHGGNEEIMGIVARELRVRHAMMAVKTSWMRFGAPDGVYGELETKYGIHGGDRETSLMLHFRPDLVRRDKLSNFPSRVAEAENTFTHLRHTGTHAFAWMAGDVNAAGTVGEAAKASAEKGRATAEHQAAGFVELLEDVRRARLADWIAG
ncbi:MAG: creatininase family protein [Pseudomonadota bacterium]|nr:creatininase family protein [Pseudomonadota bacterium]